MTQSSEEPKAVEPKAFRRKLVIAGISAVVLFALVVVLRFVIAFFVADSGDTPIVLIGGSMSFEQQSKSKPQTWEELNDRTGYHTAGRDPISLIVIKKKKSDKPGDTSSDKVPYPIPDNATWSVQLFTQNLGTDRAAVTVSPEPGTNDVDISINPQLGIFCMDKKAKPNTVYFNDSGSCPKPPDADLMTHFTKMTVNIGGTSDTQNCSDPDLGNYNCKVVFRTKPK